MLSEETARFMLGVWKRTRDQECARMAETPAAWNIASPIEIRQARLHTFDWKANGPAVFTWPQLCTVLPEANDILHACQLDPDLAALLKKAHPESDDVHACLDDDQKVALVTMVAGFNVFVTGSAGAGKSRIVNSAVRTMTAMFEYEMRDIFVTGSTGVAAFNIGGMTLHSQMMLMAHNPVQYTASLKTKLEPMATLLVDEISMVSVRDFYSVHMRMLRALKSNQDAAITRFGSIPFGGRQIIVVGDFFQLSDVKRSFTGVDASDREQDKRVIELSQFRDVSPEYKRFDQWSRTFCTPLWAQTFGHAVQLEKLHRQNDVPLMRVLTQVRWGEINQRDLFDLITARTVPQEKVPKNAMFLFATNQEARDHNARMLAEMPGPDIFFCMTQLARRSPGDPDHREQYDGEMPKHRCETTLRIGADVRIWSNYDVRRGIANGTQCKLKGLVPIGEIGIGEDCHPVEQTPALAAMKERYDGLTIRCNNPRYTYELLDHGAFSLSFTGDNDAVCLAMKPHLTSVYGTERIHPFDEDIIKASTVHKYVRREGASRGRNLDYAETPFNATRAYCTAVTLNHRPATEIFILPPVMLTRSQHHRGVQYPLISQVQMPLIPAYASTVHAAQGLSLDAVAVCLTRLQDPALPYVAMSRATSTAGLFFVGSCGLEHHRADQNVVALARLLRPKKITG